MLDLADCRLVRLEALPDLLQLDDTTIQWLIATKQLLPLYIHGELRFALRDVRRLIDTYRGVAARTALKDLETLENLC